MCRKPAMQAGHVSHQSSGKTVTLSPRCQPSTSAPTSAMVPDVSCPIGHGAAKRPSMSPWAIVGRSRRCRCRRPPSGHGRRAGHASGPSRPRRLRALIDDCSMVHVRLPQLAAGLQLSVYWGSVSMMTPRARLWASEDASPRERRGTHDLKIERYEGRKQCQTPGLLATNGSRRPDRRAAEPRQWPDIGAPLSSPSHDRWRVVGDRAERDRSSLNGPWRR